MYEGVYWPNMTKGKVTYAGCVRFLPHTDLIVGGTTGVEGLTRPFKCTGAIPSSDADFKFTFEEQPVEAKMRFVNPLPG